MRLSKRHLVIAVCGTLALVALVAVPGAARGRVGSALDGLGDADPRWLWIAGGALVVMHACGGVAWNSALRACGAHLRHADAAARYCVGSGVGAIAPAHLGSAARIALLGRAVPGEGALWRVGGVAAAVGAVRATWLAGVVVAAVVMGPIPAWPLALLALGAGAAAGVGYSSRRFRLGRRLDHLLHAFRELCRSPRRLAAIGALTLAGMVAKIAAATAVAGALGIDAPLRAAVLIVAAVELASIMPVTPGNFGVASAAVAMALTSLGIPAAAALAAGIAFGAIEILSAMAVGLLGGLVLAGPRLRPSVRLSAAIASSAALAAAVGVTTAPGL